MAVVKELFEAYKNGELPSDGGYIISVYYDDNSTYTKYEITSYNNVKSIYAGEDGLTFQADGKKMFILAEPVNYPKKHTEPAYRDDAHKIPYHFKEIQKFVTRRHDNIMIGKQPVISYGSFTILKPAGNNRSYLFFPTDDLPEAIEKYFKETLWKDANVPKIDAEKISEMILQRFNDFVAFQIG